MNKLPETNTITGSYPIPPSAVDEGRTKQKEAAKQVAPAATANATANANASATAVVAQRALGQMEADVKSQFSALTTAVKTKRIFKFGTDLRIGKEVLKYDEMASESISLMKSCLKAMTEPFSLPDEMIPLFSLVPKTLHWTADLARAISLGRKASYIEWMGEHIEWLNRPKKEQERELDREGGRSTEAEAKEWETLISTNPHGLMEGILRQSLDKIPLMEKGDNSLAPISTCHLACYRMRLYNGEIHLVFPNVHGPNGTSCDISFRYSPTFDSFGYVWKEGKLVNNLEIFKEFDYPSPSGVIRTRFFRGGFIDCLANEMLTQRSEKEMDVIRLASGQACTPPPHYSRIRVETYNYYDPYYSDENGGRRVSPWYLELGPSRPYI